MQENLFGACPAHCRHADAESDGQAQTEAGTAKPEAEECREESKHFIAADCSIAGINRLQIEAATITPAAKPAKERRTRSPSDFFMKNTQAARPLFRETGLKFQIWSAYSCLRAICSFCILPRRGIRDDCSDTVFVAADRIVIAAVRRWWCAPVLRGSTPWTQIHVARAGMMHNRA